MAFAIFATSAVDIKEIVSTSAIGRFEGQEHFIHMAKVLCLRNSIKEKDTKLSINLLLSERGYILYILQYSIHPDGYAAKMV